MSSRDREAAKNQAKKEIIEANFPQLLRGDAQLWYTAQLDPVSKQIMHGSIDMALAKIIDKFRPDPAQALEYLSSAETKILEDIQDFRVDSDYDPSKLTQTIQLPQLELLEAVRIYGSSQAGFGSYPKQLEYQIRLCGLIWYATKSKIVPRFWKDYFNIMGTLSPSTKILPGCGLRRLQGSCGAGYKCATDTTLCTFQVRGKFNS
ncbi:hypothetical protein SLS62_006364 [Diatrype stigma]|uniref:Uncharacterized protein n=1 Tax=Diatrype stigma TaxID=117547 RepID=A0AAN9V1A0_9PEZI